MNTFINFKKIISQIILNTHKSIKLEFLMNLLFYSFF